MTTPVTPVAPPDRAGDRPRGRERHDADWYQAHHRGKAFARTKIGRRVVAKHGVNVTLPTGTLTVARCEIPGHPPSVNKGNGPWQKRHAAVKYYHETAALFWLVASKGQRMVAAPRYRVTVVFHGPRRADCDNMGKAAQDAAAKALGFNDKLAESRYEPGDKSKPKCHVVTVEAIPAQVPAVEGR